MRGKGFFPCKHSVAHGITPAHAGKSGVVSLLLGRCRDHPRACGEKNVSRAKHTIAAGSPPRMRGKELEPSTVTPSSWITPAHAGKSGNPRCACRQARDHPRACGEKNLGKSNAAALMGSPPRMRGKVCRGCQFCLLLRITPAHAGKSQKLFLSLAALWDHPRACGEKQSITPRSPAKSGSPPRMRGKD